MTGLPRVRLPEGWAVEPGMLDKQVIMVTGATGGLGRVVAKSCAAAGATVVLVGRRIKALESLYDDIVAAGAPQPAICPMNFESATPTHYDELAQMVERELGRLDGVVHAAAHFDGLTPLAQHAPDQWQRTLQVNLSAPFALQQAMTPLLDAADNGVAVFVLDDPERMRSAHWGAYGVSKAAIEAMVAMLHDENGDAGFRVHALLPAPMRTALRRLAWFGEDTMKHPAPDATAEAVLYLLSPAAVGARGAMLDLR